MGKKNMERERAMCDILACPYCKSKVEIRGESIICSHCGESFIIVSGIPRLIVNSDKDISVVRKNVRAKSWDEKRATLRVRSEGNRGFLSSKCYLVLYGLISSSIILAFFHRASSFACLFIVGLLLVVLLADYFVYRVKKSRALRSTPNKLIAESPTEVSLLDELCKEADMPTPTMSAVGELHGGHKQDDFSKLVGKDWLIKGEYENLQAKIRSILEVGTGDGVLYREYDIGRDKDFVGLDISMDLLEQFRAVSDCLLVNGDGQNLPFENDTFDLVICSETLEHFADPGKGMAELARVLTPGGSLIMTVPNALRIRIFNLFHIIEILIASVFSDRLLQKTITQERLFHTAYMYYWDFSPRDMRQLMAQSKMKILRLYSRGFPFPYNGFLRSKNWYNIVENTARHLPIIKYIGSGLVVVAQKRDRQNS